MTNDVITVDNLSWPWHHIDGTSVGKYKVIHITLMTLLVVNTQTRCDKDTSKKFWVSSCTSHGYFIYYDIKINTPRSTVWTLQITPFNSC